jgi:hypothetical protein
VGVECDELPYGGVWMVDEPGQPIRRELGQFTQTLPAAAAVLQIAAKQERGRCCRVVAGEQSPYAEVDVLSEDADDIGG